MSKDNFDKPKKKDQSKFSQTTGAVFMVSPDSFGFNPETARTNFFQKQTKILEKKVKNKALMEFNEMVSVLRAQGIKVFVVPSRKGIETPDAVFPNNWISTHENGTIILYPMLAPNRRSERQWSDIQKLLNITKDVIAHDLTYLEKEGYFLEGTGSLVLDRKNKIAFAIESPRTSPIAVNIFCQITGYKSLIFHACDENDNAIYHTNVVMSIGNGFVIICPESIKDSKERQEVVSKLEKLGLEMIRITKSQMKNFCGNILELSSSDGKSKIVMSQTAFDSFSKEQKKSLRKYGDLIPVKIPTIERVGGGSARCMLAEIFCPLP